MTTPRASRDRGRVKRKRGMPKPPPSIGAADRKGTDVELQARRAYASQLLALGLPSEDVVEHLRAEGLSLRTAQRAVKAAKEMRIRSAQRGAQRARADQIDRHEAYLYGAIVNKAPLPHIMQIERNLMDLQGTRAAPLQEPPAARVQEALHRIIDEYSTEELEAMCREDERERELEIRRRIEAEQRERESGAKR